MLCPQLLDISLRMRELPPHSVHVQLRQRSRTQRAAVSSVRFQTGKNLLNYSFQPVHGGFGQRFFFSSALEQYAAGITMIILFASCASITVKGLNPEVTVDRVV